VAIWQPHPSRLNRTDPSAHKVFAQIPELGIHPSNQRKFLPPPPALNLFFTANCVTNIAETLEINQPLHFILFGEPVTKLLLVLHHTSFQTVRHTDVKHATSASKDVNVIHHAAKSAIPHSTCHAPRSERREPVIPTGAARLSRAHVLCAPGRVVEGPWQDCDVTSANGTNAIPRPFSSLGGGGKSCTIVCASDASVFVSCV